MPILSIQKLLFDKKPIKNWIKSLYPFKQHHLRHSSKVPQIKSSTTSVYNKTLHHSLTCTLYNFNHQHTHTYQGYFNNHLLYSSFHIAYNFFCSFQWITHEIKQHGSQNKKNHVKWSSLLLIVLKSEPFDQSSATAEKVKKKTGWSIYVSTMVEQTHTCYFMWIWIMPLIGTWKENLSQNN